MVWNQDRQSVGLAGSGGASQKVLWREREREKNQGRDRERERDICHTVIHRRGSCSSLQSSSGSNGSPGRVDMTQWLPSGATPCPAQPRPSCCTHHCLLPVGGSCQTAAMEHMRRGTVEPLIMDTLNRIRKHFKGPFPVLLVHFNLRKEDNLSIKYKMAGPKISTI